MQNKRGFIAADSDAKRGKIETENKNAYVVSC